MKRGLAIFGAAILLLATLVSLLSFFLPAAALPVGVAIAVVLCTFIGAVVGAVSPSARGRDPMTLKERARWDGKRRQGRTRFVCRYTFLYGPLFGLLMAIGMYLIHRYFYPQRLGAVHVYFAVGVPVSIVLSCIKGMLEWRQQERRLRLGQDARSAQPIAPPAGSPVARP